MSTRGKGKIVTAITLNPEESFLEGQAEHLAEVLAHPVTEGRRAYLVAPDGDRLELPHPILEALVPIADALSHGNGVAVVPLHKRLTTNEAAELLNVSRPHLVKLLDAKEIPFEYVGTHRRLRLGDVLEYRERRDAEREAALTDMVRVGERAKLPY